MITLVALAPVLLGILFIVAGIRKLILPIDDLWDIAERRMLLRGEAPHRNEVWEESARRGSWFLIAFGIFSLIFGLNNIREANTSPMSGVYIGDRQLTQAEWDGCNHDSQACMSQYYTPVPSR